MAVMMKPLKEATDDREARAGFGPSYLIGGTDSTHQAQQYSGMLPTTVGFTVDDLLLKFARWGCQKYNIDFVQLSIIQRKFLTHYRCHRCGLLPLYYVNMLHVKRVRCRKCGELISFKRNGKYGKLRKDIAIEFAKVSSGVVRYVSR